MRLLWRCKAEELGHLPLLQGWHFGYAQAQEARPWVATVQAVAESLHLRSDRLTLIEHHKQPSYLLELVFAPVDKREKGDKNTTYYRGNDVVFLRTKVSYFCIIGIDK